MQRRRPPAIALTRCATLAPPARADLTGLVLAGGRGLRMGGADKGLVLWRGEPLVAHVLRRFGPQVAQAMISANRNPEHYRAWAPVLTDPDPAAFAGPLAGIRVALRAMAGDWLAVVPCDLPQLPTDACARLAAGLHGAPAAHALAGGRHTLVCLLHRSVTPALDAFLERGDRRVATWLAEIGSSAVPFADADGFANFNSADDLAAADRP